MGSHPVYFVSHLRRVPGDRQEFHIIDSLCSRREITCVRWKQTASLFSLAFLSNSNPQESHSCMHPSFPTTLERLHGVIRVAGRSAPLDSEEFKRESVAENTT